MTALIAKGVRRYDHFARWGGEEFMVLLSHNGLEMSGWFAEKFRERIANHPFGSAGRIATK